MKRLLGVPLLLLLFGVAHAGAQETPPDPVCGNDILETGEECDGSAAAACQCPGACLTDCSCARPPIVTIVATDADASEVGPDPGRFVFKRWPYDPQDPLLPLTVTFGIGGTAVEHTDYELSDIDDGCASSSTGCSYDPASARTIEFKEGSSIAILVVKPLEDPMTNPAEGTETVELTLVPNCPAYLLDAEPLLATATVGIEDYVDMPQACDLPGGGQGTCKNQWLIDAYGATCAVGETVCKAALNTVEALGQACFDACNKAWGAYEQVCNWAQDGVCSLEDLGCSIATGTCAVTGVGTGCNTRYFDCRAARWGTCRQRCVNSGSCKRPYGIARKCTQCKANCRRSLATDCANERSSCIARACQAVEDTCRASVVCPVTNCETELANMCQACSTDLLNAECDLHCGETGPPCREAKQLGDACVLGQCEWGLRCRPDLASFESLGPGTLIESLLKSTDLQGFIDNMKTNMQFAPKDIDLTPCLSASDGCVCRQPLLQSAGDELDAQACMALYRPGRHIQAWLLNDAIAGSSELRDTIRQQLIDAGMDQATANEVLNRFQEVAFSYGMGGSAAAGAGLSAEVGTVYGKDCYGCYYTLCAGVDTGIGVGVSGTITVSDATGDNGAHGIDNLAGWTRYVGLSVDTPVVQLGVDGSLVFGLPLGLDLPAPLPSQNKADIFDKQAVKDAKDAFIAEIGNIVAQTQKGDINALVQALLAAYIPVARGAGVNAGVGVDTIIAVSKGLCYTWIRPSICLQPDSGGGQQCQQPVIEEPSSPGYGALSAYCSDKTAIADPSTCDAAVNVDWGSFDPAGRPLTLTQSPPGRYGIGTHTVTLTASAGEESVSDTCTVTVEDRDAPQLGACPQDLILECESNRKAGVDLSAPGIIAATDCQEPVSIAPVGRTEYALGTTTPVTIAATDNASPPNSATCVVNVSVQDTTPPAVSCKPAIVEVGATGHGTLVPADVHSSSWDACDDVSLRIDNSSFVCADLGDNVVSLAASDPSGNEGSCDALVTVQDSVAPSIKCPEDVTIPTTAGQEAIDRWLASVTAADVCDAAPAITNDAPPAFEIGRTTVEFTAADQSRNTASCTAQLTLAEVLPGRKRYVNDCNAEWAIINPHNPEPPDGYGFPSYRQTCVDGDPSCDYDGEINGSCSFLVGVCLNVNDGRLAGIAECRPDAVSEWRLRSPKIDSFDDKRAGNAVRLLDAVSDLSDSVRIGGAVRFAPAIVATDSCTSMVEVEVAARGRGLRRGRLNIKSRIKIPAGTRSLRKRFDRDLLQLSCRPAP